eukprot:gene7995-16359_t
MINLLTLGKKLVFSPKFIKSKIIYRKIPLNRYISYSAKVCQQHELGNSALFSTLGLKKFTESELSAAFYTIRSEDGTVRIQEVRELVRRVYDNKLSDEAIVLKAEYLMRALDSDNSGDVSFEEFRSHMTQRAESLDPRLWTVAMSFVSSGISLGIVAPCMPMLVQELNIAPSLFGFVISAVGISKLLGNIPAAYFVDRLGRKPLMVAGLTLCSLGLGGMALSLVPGFGTPWIVGCRLLTGLGVAVYSSGAYMFMTDVSTPLNRTRTMSPLLASFNAGMALGPAVGGVLLSQCGLAVTYATVGGLFAVLSVFNQKVLIETKPHWITHTASSTTINNNSTDNNTNTHGGSSSSHTTTTTSPPVPPESMLRGVLGSFSLSYSSWKRLIQIPTLYRVVTFNLACSAATAAAQMTMLPLLLVNPTFHMSPLEMGGTFAFTSMVSMLSSQPVAHVADKWGKVPAMLSGGALMALSFGALPYAASIEQLAVLLIPLSIGSTAIAAVPTAYVTDLIKSSDRAQAISLLRTAVDVGFLVGAASAGILADMTSVDTAIHSSGVIVSSATLWFGLRTLYHTSTPVVDNNKNS